MTFLRNALAVPGVVTVITHQDVPKLGPTTVLPFGQSYLPMQGSEIHYEGEPLALVLAETLEAATEGAARLRPTYERIQHVSFEGGRELVPRSGSEGNGFAIMEIDAQKGEVGAAFENAAAAIDQTYRTPCRHHNVMEPSATVAEWRGDTLEVHDATQWTYGVRYGLAAVFGLPPENVHVRCPYTGGGFGSKGTVWPHQVLASLAARISVWPRCQAPLAPAPTVLSRESIWGRIPSNRRRLESYCARMRRDLLDSLPCRRTRRPDRRGVSRPPRHFGLAVETPLLRSSSE